MILTNEQMQLEHNSYEINQSVEKGLYVRICFQHEDLVPRFKTTKETINDKQTSPYCNIRSKTI